MLYTRSSFLRYLTDKRDCEIVNVNDGRNRVLSLKNGPCGAFIFTNRKDIIDYEEIFIVCKKLYIDLPGNSDLEIVE